MKKLLIITMLLLTPLLVSAEIQGVQQEGEVKIYTIDGVRHEVGLVFVDGNGYAPGTAPEIQLLVDGVLTDPLSRGENQALNGIEITVDDIMLNGQAASFSIRPGASGDAPAQGNIGDFLVQGNTKTYTINGLDYELTLVFVSDPGGAPQAKFSVNGELTDALAEGMSDTAGGLRVSVDRISTQDRQATVTYTLSLGTAQSNGDESLGKGESRNYAVGGKDYSITLLGVDASSSRYSARIAIDGKAVTVYQGSNVIDGMQLVVTVISPAASGAVAERIEFQKPQLAQDSGKFIVVVGKYAPTADVLASVDITRSLQDSGAGVAILDEQFQQRFSAVPDDVVIFLIRGKTIHLIVGERASADLATSAVLVKNQLKAKGYTVEEHLSTEVSMRLFDPQYLGQDYPGVDPAGYPGSPGVDPGRYPGMPGVNPDDYPIAPGVTPGSQDPAVAGQDGTWTPRSASCDTGCLVNERCVPIGTRIANGGAQYCSIEGQMSQQSADGSSCQNSYECVSNQCLNAQCVSLEKELRETRNVIQGFMDWWRSVFA